MNSIFINRDFSFLGIKGFFFVSCALCLVPFFSGCVTVPKPSVNSDDQKLQAVAIDLYKNEDSRSAAQKILGVNTDKPVIKYSPVTGKHYSGDLEFDPETGAKLEVVKD